MNFLPYIQGAIVAFIFVALSTLQPNLNPVIGMCAVLTAVVLIERVVRKSPS